LAGRRERPACQRSEWGFVPALHCGPVLGARTPVFVDLIPREDQRRLASILSQIIAAISAPPNFLIARMPVGEVTLISVR
jgi:hypothetical protein